MDGQPAALLASKPAAGSMANEPNCVPLNTNEVKRAFSDVGAHFDNNTFIDGNIKPWKTRFDSFGTTRYSFRRIN